MYQNFNTLLQTLLQYKLFPPNEAFLIAVSGGADSLTLLHFLATHRSQLNIRIHCATLNHGLRPSASDDTAFVEQFANAHNIACTVGFADVPEIAKTQNIGIETAARLARYNFLAETANNLNIKHVVTAHHADDQSETILMHILRGSGSNGLQGMSAISTVPYFPKLTLVRPLLHMRRSEIDAYCLEHALQARIDESNFDTKYLRNEIRHEILPRLRQINPQLDHALAKLADISSTEQEFMAQSYHKYFKTKIRFTERVSIPLAIFQNWHLAIQRYCIVDALNYFDVEPSFDHIQSAIQTAIKGQVGAISEFSANYRLRVDYDNLYIEPTNLPLPPGDYLQINQTISVSIPSELNFGDYALIVSNQPMSDYDACLSIPKGTNVILRPRQAGDRFQPQGLAGGHQKIKKWLINNKIPRHIRDKLPLLIIDEVVAAIVLPQGWCIGEKFTKNETSQVNTYFKVNKLL